MNCSHMSLSFLERSVQSSAQYLWSRDLIYWFSSDLKLKNRLWTDQEYGKHLLELNPDNQKFITLFHITHETTQCSEDRVIVENSVFWSEKQERNCSHSLSPQPPASSMRDHRGNMVALSKQGERAVCFLSQHLKAPLTTSIMTF